MDWLSVQAWFPLAAGKDSLCQFSANSSAMLGVPPMDLVAYHRIPIINIAEDQFSLGMACRSSLRVWTSSLDLFLEEWNLTAQRSDIRAQLLKQGGLLSHEELFPVEGNSGWYEAIQDHFLIPRAECELSGAESLRYELEFELKEGGPSRWEVFITPELWLEDRIAILVFHDLADFDGNHIWPDWSETLRVSRVHLDEDLGRIYIATGGERSQKAVKEALQWGLDEGTLGREVRAGTLRKAINSIPDASEVAERIFEKEDEDTVSWLYRMADWELAKAVTKENVSFRFESAQLLDTGAEAVLTGCQRKEVPDWLDQFVQAEESHCELEWGMRGSRIKQPVIIRDVTEHSVTVRSNDGRDLSGVQGKSIVLTIRGVGGWLRKLVNQLQTMVERDEYLGLLDLLEAEAQEKDLMMSEFCRVVYGPPGTGKTTRVVADAMNALSSRYGGGCSQQYGGRCDPHQCCGEGHLGEVHRIEGVRKSRRDRCLRPGGFSLDNADRYRRMSCSIMPRVTGMGDFGILAVTAHRLLLQSAVIDGLRRYDSVRVVFDGSQHALSAYGVWCL